MHMVDKPHAGRPESDREKEATNTRQGLDEVTSGQTVTSGELKMTRRSFLKKGAVAAVGMAPLTGGYASVWEPHRLEITRLSLSFPGLPSSFDGMRIVHFSDMHLGFFTNDDHIDHMAEAIRQLQPDLLCFTGDIVDDYADSMQDYLPLLTAMEAPLGKYAVLGNHDYRGIPEGVQALYKHTGFRLLKNEHEILERHGERLAIVGLEDLLLSKPDLSRATAGIPATMFKLLLMHAPDFADQAAEAGIHLQLSGHSHGGQIRAPFLGALKTPPGGRKYVQGLYSVGERKMPVYVNRGIGMTQLPVRVLCPPELTVLTLRRGQDV